VKEALEELRRGQASGDPFAVAMIDFVLPDETGVDLAKEIRKDSALSGTRLILLAEIDTPGLADYAIESGCKAYLTKPVRQSMMLEAILGVIHDGPTIISRSPADIHFGNDRHEFRRKELILVAEDYPINQQVAQLYLDELGFSVHIVENGEEAVAAVKTTNYNLILMDCQMPEMDGFAATQAIREYEKRLGRHVPIIAMTARSMGGDREHCLEVGMDDYISKPVEPSELRRILDKWIPFAISDSDEKTQADDLPILIDELRQRYMAQTDSLLRMFVDQVPTEFERVKDALEAADSVVFLQRVHGLKGMCATMSARRMKTLCDLLEIAASETDWTRGTEVFKQLSDEFLRVEEYILAVVGD